MVCVIDQIGEKVKSGWLIRHPGVAESFENEMEPRLPESRGDIIADSELVE